MLPKFASPSSTKGGHNHHPEACLDLCLPLWKGCSGRVMSCKTHQSKSLITTSSGTSQSLNRSMSASLHPVGGPLLSDSTYSELPTNGNFLLGSYRLTDPVSPYSSYCYVNSLAVVSSNSSIDASGNFCSANTRSLLN